MRWAPEVGPVTVARLAAADVEPLVAGIRRSSELLHPWVDPPTEEDVWRERAEQGEDRAVTFVLHHDDGLVGVVRAGEIVRGALESCHLGLYALLPQAGRGLFRQGLAGVLDRLLSSPEDDGVGLHRIEANIQPANERSIHLVRSMGFRREGFSPRYLRINGEWRDHERWALLADDPRPDRT